MNISVIIPAYNEEKRIGNGLSEIVDFCKNNTNNYEIIVMDDCSTDKTNEICSNYKKHGVNVVKTKSRKGKGHTIKKGFELAKHDLVLSNSNSSCNYISSFFTS